jgi:hypothetical protein
MRTHTWAIIFLPVIGVAIIFLPLSEAAIISLSVAYC